MLYVWQSESVARENSPFAAFFFFLFWWKRKLTLIWENVCQLEGVGRSRRFRKALAALNFSALYNPFLLVFNFSTARMDLISLCFMNITDVPLISVLLRFSLFPSLLRDSRNMSCGTTSFFLWEGLKRLAKCWSFPHMNTFFEVYAESFQLFWGKVEVFLYQLKNS